MAPSFINKHSVVIISLLYLALCPLYSLGQHITGNITDRTTLQSLPFATIKLGNTGEGMVTDLTGSFDITLKSGIDFIEISYLGYETERITLPVKKMPIAVALTAKEGSLNEVTIKPPYEKIRRIINNAIDNRDKNNPDKYDWYQCKVYYKMLADVIMPDSILMKDTSADTRETKEFFDNQHLLMSETYSLRTWKKPQKLQEEVLGTRFSGFKRSVFTSLVTDVLPFHAYTDYISLNGKDYHNPISKGFFQHYDFNLNDELLQGTDTIWILSFRPQKGYNGLKGTVYINSDSYAIAYLIANAEDKALNRDIRLEHQYKKIDGKWFPNELNYIIRYSLSFDENESYNMVMKGSSRIDSISFEENKRYKFDKAHSTRLVGNADVLSDSAWAALRPIALDTKEKRTYIVIDSLMESVGFDKIMHYLEKLPEGKVPVSIFDLDLARLYSFNRYERNRFGLGLQTNEKIARWFSLGGWFGYGTGDKVWKYGGFAEIYADRNKEFVFRLAYDYDLRDPGRISLNKEIDKNYLRRYLMNRVDQVEAYSASVKKRLGYWTLELSGRKEYITPKYNYAFRYEGANHYKFEATEASLNWRYAFAERRAPAFGRYYNTGSKYPVWYGKVTSGILESGPMQTKYVQAVTALQWHKHINRIGNEHFLLMAGKTWSDNPLPLSKAFAGNGLRYDNNISYYSFGGLLTMYPYEYYSDQFASITWRHDLDWKLYTVNFGSTFSSAPYLSLGHNILYGTMSNSSVHKNVSFSVPDKGYHESGILANSLLRLNYFNVYYFTVNVGYFYHWAPTFDLGKNGRYVLGFGVDL